jgi:hypothetical protein
MIRARSTSRVSMKRCNPKKKRVIRRASCDPEDAPEWSAQQFERAEIAVGGRVVREAQGTLTRPRGQSRKTDTKVKID